ncbi:MULTISPECIES: ROK family transcriptional regulator [Streptomyces]|uniref:Sugar kinase of the NBD/HSP70 family, may contain an N-terminal HTH domain n=1 Tax=Streptomyces harbinensis TaxID=1176198 RepID=A0A1I6VPY2_9ACTN|nr:MULTISPECIES: ROK family transcriptional regulator [Streptomyces]SFT15641.1 Sugar kinase of the NBD/HSP70 family, may contain an N-terminal HTH domain [Streptomyces harbinensis]
MSGPAGAMPHASSRAAVLDVIRAAGTISRVGLVGATGFTGATISTVVRRLIDDGLVVESGHAESTGGKRRVLLQLNRSARYAVGVHLDHDGITYVLTDLGGSVVARMSRAGVGVEDPRSVVERMAAESAALIEGAGIERERVLGLGLVAPGPLNQGPGSRLMQPAIRHWGDFPLGAGLQEATGLPVVLDNDATAAALGEHWSGQAGGGAFAALYMGTGIGAGLLLGGIPYRGPSGNAGEIGHIPLAADGPQCWCGARGCTEALAGPGAVVEAARADAVLARSAGLSGEAGRGRRTADFAAVTRAAHRGDPGARALLERSARYLALAARTLATIADLEELVLTGPGLAIAGSIYLPVVQEELERSFFSRASHPVRVRLSRMAATAPAIGAAAMMLQSELVPLREGTRLPENLTAAEPAPAAAPHGG